MQDDLADHIRKLHVPPALDQFGKWVHCRNARTGTTSMDEGPLKGCLMRRRDPARWDAVWRSCFAGNLHRMTIFTFVRNPWDRICSAFYHCRDRAKTAENKIDPKWQFREWVKEVLAVQGPAVNMHFAEQHGTAYFQGEPFASVGRFERMEVDWQRLAKVIGASPELPHWNANGYESYADHYDDETRCIIAYLYRNDIQAFGYEFGK